MFSFKRSGGFTLIELMITIVILAIISAIAIPSYSKYTDKSRRAAVKEYMVTLAQKQEQYRLNERTYAVDNTSTSVKGYTTLNYAPDANDVTPYYTVSVGTANATGFASTFTISATAIGAQLSDDTCRTLTLTHDGVRGAIDAESTPNDTTDICW